MQVEDGGISFAASTAAFYFIQSYDRLDGLELNNTKFYSLKPAGLEIGHLPQLILKITPTLADILSPWSQEKEVQIIPSLELRVIF